jgi:hypothetical protein
MTTVAQVSIFLRRNKTDLRGFNPFHILIGNEPNSGVLTVIFHGFPKVLQGDCLDTIYLTHDLRCSGFYLTTTVMKKPG